MSKAHDPITPGEILLTEFMTPLNLTLSELASMTGLSIVTIHDIIRGKQYISKDISLRLAMAFNVHESFWLHIQEDYDIEMTN